ncbi:hypothetical protein QLX08_000681 [Tetragonisca angustula]|uniref:Uncharacterized protein n=1 Tax=Tetragonisca angustula TaxID=166442 RepID=A0AAW1AIT7_9HYME
MVYTPETNSITAGVLACVEFTHEVIERAPCANKDTLPPLSRDKAASANAINTPPELGQRDSRRRYDHES